MKSDLDRHLENPKYMKRFREETIILYMMDLRFHKMKRKKQVKYCKRLLKRLMEQI
jgi:hypothetical protein